jgi:hypothetical protein
MPALQLSGVPPEIAKPAPLQLSGVPPEIVKPAPLQLSGVPPEIARAAPVLPIQTVDTVIGASQAQVDSVPLGKASARFAQGLGSARFAARLAQEAGSPRRVACEENSRLESEPQSSMWSQKLMSAVCAEMQNIAEENRLEMREYCDRLCCDLEERLTNHIVELKRDIRPQGTMNTNSSIESLTEQIQSLGKKLWCSKDLAEASRDPDMCAGPSSILSIENESPDKTDVVSRISEEVNSQINAKFAETHQSIYESFVKVLDIIQDAPWAGEREKTFPVDSISLMVMETHKQCKSLSVELRQLRQRWNQDLCKTEVRFGNLENSLRTTHSRATSTPVSPDRASTSILNEQMSKLEGLRAKLQAREASCERSPRAPSADPTSTGAEEALKRKHCETAKNLLQARLVSPERKGKELFANMELDNTIEHVPENVKVPPDGNEGPQLFALEHHIQDFDIDESRAIALPTSCAKTKEKRGGFDDAALRDDVALRKLEKGAPAGA